MPKLHTIPQGAWNHMQQQQPLQPRPPRDVQRAVPAIIREAPAPMSRMMATAPTRARDGIAHTDERRGESAEKSPSRVTLPNARSQPPPAYAAESNPRSAGRVMSRRGRTGQSQPRGTLTASEAVIARGDAEVSCRREREERPRLPSEPTARALEEFFNEEQSAEEQRVQRCVTAQHVARPSLLSVSVHQRTVMAEEEDLFSSAAARSYSSVVTATQGGMGTARAPSRATPRQHAVRKPLPTPQEADIVVHSEPSTPHQTLQMWLPRRVEALCALTCVDSPRIMRDAAGGDLGQERLRITPPPRQSPTFPFERGDNRAHSTQRDYAGDSYGSFQVALWRRAPSSAPPHASAAAGNDDDASTSLLSSPRWCVTAYESLSLSLPATARHTDDDGQGSAPQQAPVPSTAFPHRGSSLGSSLQGRSGAREDEAMVADAEDDEDAAAVSDGRDHRPPTALASPRGSAPFASALTRVYWSPAPPPSGVSPRTSRHSGATEFGADGDHWDSDDDGAAFEGGRSSRRILRRSVPRGARAGDQHARPFSVSPLNVSAASATAARNEPFCEPPSSATCEGRRAVAHARACKRTLPTELHITLPWLLHTSVLPPVAAEALARCLVAHIKAHQPPATGTRGSRARAPNPAAINAEDTLSAAHDLPRLPSPPPIWVAVFAHTKAMHMYVTNRASSLVHAEEDTGGCDVSRDCTESSRPTHGRLASAPRLDLIPWPVWVPDAQSSVCRLTALTSGAFLLIEMIARALDQAAAPGRAAAAAPAALGTVMGGDAGGRLHVGIGASRTASMRSSGAATVLHRFHIFCEAVFGDAANKRLCRHVRDRLPMRARDLSELLSRPWCGVAGGDEDSGAGAAAAAVAGPGVWRARCPSMLDLVHHLARTWMVECFAGLADRLHLFLITHNPGVVLDLITRTNDSGDGAPPEDLSTCPTPLKGVCGEKRDASTRAQQRGCALARERHYRLHHGSSLEVGTVPGATAAAAQVLPPHALIYRGIAEFIHGPLQRWERWWLSALSSPPTHSFATNATASAATVQWSTHVNYATVHSLQWVLRHPFLAPAVDDGVRQSALTLAAVKDTLALLELLTLMPPLLDTAALLTSEAEAVLRSACACVMGNGGDGGGCAVLIAPRGAGIDGLTRAGPADAPSCTAAERFHVFFRVFLGLVCHGAMQLKDAEGMALLSHPLPPLTGAADATVPAHHRGAASPLPELRTAQATVDHLWTRHILPLVVGYVSGSGTGAAPAAQMDALTAASQCITYALMLLQLLRLEARGARRCSRGYTQAPAFPNGARHAAPNSGMQSCGHRRKRTRSAALDGPVPQPWVSARSTGSDSQDARPRCWVPLSSTANERPSVARSPEAGSVSSSAFTADTATTATTVTTGRCVNGGHACVKGIEQVGAAAAEARCSPAVALGYVPQQSDRDVKSAARGAAGGLLDDLADAFEGKPLASLPHRIPPLELLAHGGAGRGAARQCPACPALPPDWQGVCRHLIRRWLQPLARTAMQSSIDPRGSSSSGCEAKAKSDCRNGSGRESALEEKTAARHEEADRHGSIQADGSPEGLPPPSRLFDFYEEGGGYTLHRRDIRRVCALLVGLARRVAAVREEERGAHAEGARGDRAGCCYDYLYGILPPGLRASDAGLIRIVTASTSSSDDGEDDDTDWAGGDAHASEDLTHVSVLRCSSSTISTTASSGSGSSSQLPLDNPSKMPASPPSSSPATPL
ncbi:hypothetical protein LSCM1_08082 [Leishmania martiniquensis]|uniref:Uncharacterized protein n=1 Tax=Leishmania martiniquensis TaxID=1580590 RepID=A0A836L3Y1_9TRYP|nr:hypothetical protein LSCM1_08082 [Leishmania martiniquensis]